MTAPPQVQPRVMMVKSLRVCWEALTTDEVGSSNLAASREWESCLLRFGKVGGFLPVTSLMMNVEGMAMRREMASKRVRSSPPEMRLYT